MNGLLKNWLHVAAFIVLGFTSAQGAESNNINVAGKNAVVVSFEDIQSKKANIRLIDQVGTELWSSIIRNTTSYKKKINLRNLPNGIYTIVMNDGDVVFMQKIEKGFNEIKVIEESALITEAPKTNFVDGHLTLNYASDQVKLYSVLFQDMQGIEIYRDEPTYEGAYNRVYDLTNLPQGKYNILMRTDLKTFYKSITINK